MKTLSPRTMAQIAAAVVITALGVVYRFPPETHSFYPGCPFFTWLQVQCPGCGSTRALYALLHLHAGEAVAFNPMFPAAFFLATAWGMVQYASATWRNKFMRIELSATTYWAASSAAVIFAVVRNIL